MPAIAVDLGGTFLRCAVVSDSGVIGEVVTQRIDRAAEREDRAAVWGRVFEVIEGFAAGIHPGLNREDPIAFAFPGPIVDHARIIGAPTVVGDASEMPDLVQILQERTGRKVYLLNDVSAAAWYFFDISHADRFMVVTVSSGIGSKLVDRGPPARVLDEWAFAGEIGHIMVDSRADAPECECGGRGHLGAIASGRGTENLARRMSRLDPAAFGRSICVTSFGATQERLTNEEHLVPAALAGDLWAWNIIIRAQVPLAQVLATAIVAASLERVLVIGGFAASLGNRYIDSLRESVRVRTNPGLLAGAHVADTIELGQFVGEACLRGAGLFAATTARSVR